MALFAKHQDLTFGIGDRVRIDQVAYEGDKERHQYFEGIVISIKGRHAGKTITVRKVGEGGIGIEKIFPLELPSLKTIKVIKKGTQGVRRAKLYFIRGKSPSEIETIYTKAATRESQKRTQKLSQKKKRAGKKRK